MVATQVLKNVAHGIREFASRAIDAYDVTVYAAGLATMSDLDVQCVDALAGVCRKVKIMTRDENDYRVITVNIVDVEACKVDIVEELDESLCA